MGKMTSNRSSALRAACGVILRRPEVAEWTVQGFGMLRTYLDDEKVFRLNVWHSSLQVPGVSIIHDHPWHFWSLVLAGRLTNVKYLTQTTSRLPPNYEWSVIKTGEGGGPDGESGACHLAAQRPIVYCTGDWYGQDAKEVHATSYGDGTVTINLRRRLEDGEHARVFWPKGESWVDAEPRPATPEEVSRVCGAAARLYREEESR